jgi:hypothetical protein
VARAEDADRDGTVERHPARHHAARPAGAEVGDVAPVDQRRERAGREVEQRDEIARTDAFDGVVGFGCAEPVGMIGGEQDAHPAATKAGGEARRNDGVARRFMAKDVFQESDAVAIAQDAADRMMIDEYCHEARLSGDPDSPIAGRRRPRSTKRTMCRLEMTEKDEIQRTPVQARRSQKIS